MGQVSEAVEYITMISYTTAFVKSRPGGPFVIRRVEIAGDRLSNRGLNELLDDILAQRMQENEDRQAMSERRADDFRTRWLRIHDEANAIRDRLGGHAQEYRDRTSQPISDERLSILRAEAEGYERRRQRRDEEQNRRDRERERELVDASLGRRAREDLQDYGFVEFRRPG